MKKTYLVLLVLCSVCSVFAQNKVITLAQFIQQVKQYHPVAKQANLLVAKASAEILMAKGAFDPTINFDAANKTLDEKNYYYYTNPELKLPLPVGDIKNGVENNGGDRLSSEITAGKSSYFGVEVPLAKGLLIDKRRAALQMAKVYKKQSEQEQLMILNNLLFDAYIAYTHWQTMYQQYEVYNNFVTLSSNRLRLVRIAAQNGDRSAMDTLEALTQLQQYQIQQTEAYTKLMNARLDVSNYLWNEKDSAVNMSDDYIPAVTAQETASINTESLVNNALLQSPAVQYYNFKLDGLNIERKLKKQNLLPYINAKANLLNKDYAVFNGFSTATLQNNYKWGIDFKFPLFIREGRGEVKKATIKIQETQLELNNKKQQIQTKILSYYNEYLQLQKQIALAKQSQNNYNSLYKNELLKFNNGESSLFLVNSRESKLLEAQQKLIELQFKHTKAKYAIDWAAFALN